MFDRSGRIGKGSTRQKIITKVQSFSGPLKGLVKSMQLGKGPDGGADVLQNIWPTSTGGKARGGCSLQATLASAATHIATYEAAGFASKMFASDASAIYDITTQLSPVTTIPTPVQSGFTSGDWSSLQFVSAGLTYLMMVNGTDDMRQWNGTAWATINGASSPAITGIATNQISQIWNYKRRIWGVQKDSLSAWYLPVLSRAGAMTEFPLGNVFKRGGKLLFGTTWSFNAGNGLGEYCMFVSTKGEVAVYSGTDPATDMALVQVYQIGIPLHKNAHFTAGGDRAILTAEGIVAISSAASSDRAALPMQAITLPIHEDWVSIVKSRAGAATKFNCTLWSSSTLLIVGVPSVANSEKLSLAANSVSGAWSRITNWDIAASNVFNDRLFFGTSNGQIFEGDVTGSDNGLSYDAVYLPAFNTFGQANDKAVTHARIVSKTNYPYTPTLFGSVDFYSSIPASNQPDIFVAGSLWNSAIWNDTASIWGGGATSQKNVVSQWQSISGFGSAVSAGVLVTFGQLVKPDFEIVRIDLRYEDGIIGG